MNRSPDTYRNNNETSPDSVQVKRMQSGLNVFKNEKKLGNKFHLNLQAIEKPDRQSEFDRINKTPVELERKKAGNSESLL